MENYFRKVPISADSIQLPIVKNVARKSVRDIYLKDLQERISSTRQMNEDSTDEIDNNILENGELNKMPLVATIEQVPLVDVTNTIELIEEPIDIAPIEHEHEPSVDAAIKKIGENKKCSACVPLVRIAPKLHQNIFSIFYLVCSKRNTIN